MHQSFRAKNDEIDRRGLRQKIDGAASRLGAAALEQILTLYYVWAAKETPWRSKLMIAAALAYFVLPFDAVPDFLVPLGFTDDLAVIGLVLTQVKNYVSDAVRLRARNKAKEILQR